jgi:ADP-ribose pyrophosphatase YjhB (NUDIX family)
MVPNYTIYFYNRKFIITSSLNDVLFADSSFFCWGKTELDEIPNLIDFFQRHTEVASLLACSPKPDEAMKRLTQSFNHIEAAGGVVCNTNNEILLIKRFGRWDLPKGKVEPKEPIPDAALREVTEETGVKNISLGEKITTTYHTYSMHGKQMLKSTHWFKMYTQANDALIPQTEEGIEQVKWVKQSDIYVYLAGSYSSLLSVLSELG